MYRIVKGPILQRDSKTEIQTVVMSDSWNKLMSGVVQ